MKIFITSILSFYFALVIPLTLPVKQLEAAFSQGNAEAVMNYGTTKMLISINGNEGVYSKSQGTQILNNFFKTNPPKSFSFDFKGKEEGASTYAMGVYKSKKDFQVSIKFQKVKNQHLIDALTISPSK